ncbi:hypothetical protein ACJJTC_019040 [Scirpophaga incertulas]
MGYYCTVPQCTSLAGKTKNVKFHRFPRDVTMADKWNLILRRGKPYTKYSKVCSLHFTQADYNVTTMGQWKTLSKDAVPSQNLPKLNADGSVMVIRKSRTVKYRESKKEDSNSEKSDKWSLPVPVQTPLSSAPPVSSNDLPESHDSNVAYRLQTLSAIASSLAPAPQQNIPESPEHKPKKQDAFMQTDPVQSEEDDTQNTTYDTEKSFTDEQYQVPLQEEDKLYDVPKDYTKSEEDYIPQTNEEYNSEAEKYALERKSHNGYEKTEIYPKNGPEYPKMDIYSFSDKYSNRPENWYTGYPDSVGMLRNQQHNLQILQEQHRITENQNFFNENHIKQEVDVNHDEEKFVVYEHTTKAEQLDANAMSTYEEERRVHQMKLLDHLHNQVKREPDSVPDVNNVNTACDSAIQPQGSPFYPSNGHNVTNGYYEQMPRPGPELLIAKQNALAAHPQLWQNTMKRPFFYSEHPHYNPAPLLQRYEDFPRILQ